VVANKVTTNGRDEVLAQITQAPLSIV
jgi:hypothetical protein